MSNVFDILENHPATIALEQRGLTSEQLRSIRFFKYNPEIPIDGHAITWNDISLAFGAGNLSLLRQYAICRHALEGVRKVDDAKNVARAFEIAEQDRFSRYVELRMAHQATQRARAKKPRAVFRDTNQTLKEFVTAFVRKLKFSDMTAKEIWPEFFSHLDLRGLNPIDHGDIYEFDVNEKRRYMSRRTFEGYVSRARRIMRGSPATG